MSPVVKRKTEKFKLPGKYVLLIFTAICLSLMIITFTTDFKASLLDNAAGAVIVPFQRGIATISTWMVEMVGERRSVNELIEENLALQEQIDALTNENTLLMQDKYELSNLRELYELDLQYSEYEKIGARIIASNSSNWFNSFIIDKGTDDGIMVNMNVIAGSGLVGIVVETGSNWARVNSIINDSSYVSASVLHTQDNMVVSGDMQLIEQGVIAYSQLIDEEGLVQKGDKIVTSNISDKYLPGILIGYVASVEMDSNNLTKSGYITPAVDFEHLSEVLVITQLKQPVEE